MSERESEQGRTRGEGGEVKYYQLREFETEHPESHDGVVSEEELKQRCEIVASIFAGHSLRIRGWNEARDVLINGEKEVEHE